jgi:hypothetical protein
MLLSNGMSKCESNFRFRKHAKTMWTKHQRAHIIISLSRDKQVSEMKNVRTFIMLYMILGCGGEKRQRKNCATKLFMSFFDREKFEGCVVEKFFFVVFEDFHHKSVEKLMMNNLNFRRFLGLKTCLNFFGNKSNCTNLEEKCL